MLFHTTMIVPLALCQSLATICDELYADYLVTVPFAMAGPTAKRDAGSLFKPETGVPEVQDVVECAHTFTENFLQQVV